MQTYTFTPPIKKVIKNLIINTLTTLYILSFTTQAQALNVVFRYDDPTLRPDSITQEMLIFFKEKNIPITIALIPCDANEEYIASTDSNWLHLLQGDNVEIALHGLTHQVINNAGEFGNLNLDENYRRIYKGKQYVEKYFKPVETFIPPFNAYNSETLKVLDSLNFRTISSDLFLSHSLSSTKINYFPETLGLLMDKMGMFEAAQYAITNNEKLNSTCVIMFHHYDIDTTEKFNKMKQVVEYCANNPQIKTFHFRDLNQNSSSYRYILNCEYNFLYKQLNLWGCLHETSFLLMIKFLNILIHLLIAIIPIFFLNSRFKYIFLLLEVLVIGTIVYFNVLSPMKGLLVVCCVFIINLIITILYNKKLNF
jgi:predicted deacetylase